jgi:hypothetical protein
VSSWDRYLYVANRSRLHFLLLGFGYLPDQLQVLLIVRQVLSLNPTTRESHSELI